MEDKPKVPPPPPWKVKDRQRTLDIKAEPQSEEISKSENKSPDANTVKKLRRVGVLSFAKLYAVLGLLTGLVISIVYGFLYFLFGNYPEIQSLSEGFDSGLINRYGIIAIVAIPVLYTLAGFVGGAIAAFGFNIMMKIIGGIEIELEE